MMRNTVRGVLGLVLTAAAMWVADKMVDRMFGSDVSTTA